MLKKITHCRICQATPLVSLIHVGFQALTGVFPKTEDPSPETGPLELVKCQECHLVQLAHSFSPENLYGMTYGYRSGLNQSMVRHLQEKVSKIESLASLNTGDTVLDIGSNDGTLLGSYAVEGLTRIGIDPSGVKFKQYYPEDATLIPDFFSAARVRKAIGNKKINAITSIAMFYDLEKPQEFVNQIAELLAPEGVWVFEQSYLPAMLEANSYDTICHEHLEYYSLYQVLWMLKKAGLKAVQLEFNDVNGGSFSVTAAKNESSYQECTELIEGVLKREYALGLHSTQIFAEFKNRVEQHREELLGLLETIRAQGKTVLGFGASTKGNVLLQYCGLTKKEIPFVAEVNPDKFGARTPGTDIPIISESDAFKLQPDFLLVLPWHFRKNILERNKVFLEQGGTFIFPLPHLELVTEGETLSGRVFRQRLSIPPTIRPQGEALRT